jgi:hypothetical protein
VKKLTLVFLGAGFFFAHAQLQADPIYVQPGQCIMVGTQQVCAQVQNPAVTTPDQEPKTIFTCVYGKHEGSDLPSLKSYALVQTLLGPKGRKTEMVIKNYGVEGKGDCEKEAERLRASHGPK